MSAILEILLCKKHNSTTPSTFRAHVLFVIELFGLTKALVNNAMGERNSSFHHPFVLSCFLHPIAHAADFFYFLLLATPSINWRLLPIGCQKDPYLWSCSVVIVGRESNDFLLRFIIIFYFSTYIECIIFGNKSSVCDMKVTIYKVFSCIFVKTVKQLCQLFLCFNFLLFHIFSVLYSNKEKGKRIFLF